MATRPRATPRATARRPPRPALNLLPFVPSGRSLAIGVAIALIAAAGYTAALETSLFAVRTIEITGGTPRLKAEVRRALAPELGRSLVRVGRGTLEQRTASIPDLRSLHFDRAFPNTLRVTVKAERPLLLLRQGSHSWLVSARARVLRKLAHPERSSLPRVWVTKSVPVQLGRILPAADGGLAAAALAPLAALHFPARFRTIRESESELTLVAVSGFEVRLGDIGDLRLKLAVARRILRVAGGAATATGYLDVSVPQRPVYRS
jgi:cell division protein FtsQ